MPCSVTETKQSCFVLGRPQSNMYINQQDAQNSVIRLYFSLDALHVSDYVSPSSGATFYKLYIAFGICRYHKSGCCVAIATQQPDVSVYAGPISLAVVWL